MQVGNTILSVFVRWSWIVLVVASFAQCILFPSTPNFLAVALSILAWFIFTSIFLKPSLLESYPISVFVILGFVSTQFYLPIVATLLEGKPVVFNLEAPEMVFYHSGLILVALLMAHFIYRTIFSKPPDFLQFRLIRLGLYAPPNDLQLWLIGLLGMLAMIIVSVSGIGYQAEKAETSSIGVKIVQGFLPFTYAPFFMLFGKLYGRKANSIGVQRYFLILYAFALIIVGVARNARGWFMSSLTSIAFIFVLGLLLGIIVTRLFTARNVAILLFTVWLITGPLVDLGLAMLIVRSQRYEVSPEQLIANTWEAYKDKNTIRLFKDFAINQEISSDWDEYYLDNIFLARFCNIKFNDLSIVQSQKMNPYDQSMMKFSIDRLWAELPRPVLTLINADVDKDFLNLVSYGDYLYYKAGASSSVLGGKRLGNIAGTGMAAFGWWYLVFLVILIIPSFILMDLLILRAISLSRLTSDYRLISIRFSISAIISISIFWQYLNAESIMDFGGFLIRGWIQIVLLYLFVYHSTRLIVNSFIR